MKHHLIICCKLFRNYYLQECYPSVRQKTANNHSRNYKEPNHFLQNSNITMVSFYTYVQHNAFILKAIIIFAEIFFCTKFNPILEIFSGKVQLNFLSCIISIIIQGNTFILHVFYNVLPGIP